MENWLRIHRSLTIKQMATVSSVAVLVICVFILLQLFHFVKQRRIEYAQQMENIAHTIRQPLSVAVLRGDLPEAEQILRSLKPAGVLGRADILLPDAFLALNIDYSEPMSIPNWMALLFDLPMKISLPLYSTEYIGVPKPLAYLVLEADSSRVYQFILSTVATMIMTYLLLALVLSITLSWCINRLVIHPLRELCRSLIELDPENNEAKLAVPPGHQDDEIGILVKIINRRQRAKKTNLLPEEFKSDK